MIICSDLDGTILVNKSVDIEIANKIKQYRKKNNYFVIVTGRGKGVFEKAMNDYNIDFFDYVILSNGGCICDSNLKEIKYTAFSSVEVINILEKLSLYKDEFRKYIINTKDESIDMKYQYNLSQGNKFVISIAIQFYNENVTKKVFQNLKAMMGTKYNLFINKDCIDILPKNVSKDTAIVHLLNLLKLSENDLYVIGDGKNDISMLKKFKNSFTFSYCDKDVLKSSKYIVESYMDFFNKIEDM